MEEQKKAVKRRQAVWFLVSYVVICIGSGLLPLLFFRFYVLGSLGVSFVLLGIVGIIGMRRITRELKGTNPELYAALRADTEKRVQELRARQLRFSDLPRWLIVLFVIEVALINMELLGFFSSSPPLETLLTILMFLFVAYFSLYVRKIRNRKKKQAIS